MKQPNRAFMPLLLIILIYALGYFLVLPVFYRLVIDNSTHLIPAGTSNEMKYLLFSLCIGLDAFGYFFGGPMMGTWSDSVGRKKILIVSLLLTFVAYALCILGIVYSQILLIIIGRTVSGFASSSQSLAQTAVADMSEGKQKSIYFAIISAVMTIAMLIGPPIGSYLSDQSLVYWFNETTPFYFALFLISLTFALTLITYNDSSQERNKQFQLSFRNFGKAVNEALSTLQLRSLFFLFFISQLGWSFFFQDIMIYLPQKFNYTLNSASVFMTYSGICMALGLLAYKHIVQHVELHTIMRWSFVLCLLSFCAWELSPLDWPLYLIVIPGAVGSGLIQPTLMTLLSDAVPKEKQGWILGFAASAFAAPWCISAFLFAPLSQMNLSYPIITAIFCFALGSFTCFKNQIVTHTSPSK